MALLRKPSSSCPYGAGHPYLLWHLAIYWHDLHLPSTALQTSAGINSNYQQHHSGGAPHYYHLDNSLVRTPQRDSVRDGTMHTATTTTLHHSNILKESSEEREECSERH